MHIELFADQTFQLTFKITLYTEGGGGKTPTAANAALAAKGRNDRLVLPEKGKEWGQRCATD